MEEEGLEQPSGGEAEGGEENPLRESSDAEELDLDARRRPRFPGHEILVGESAREVLHRLLDGDPLHLQDRCRLRLRQRGMFFPLPRLHLKAAARCAYASMMYDGVPALGRWIEKCIDQALSDYRAEQHAEEKKGIPPESSEDAEYYAEFSRTTGIELGISRLACLALNHLPPETRRAFYEIAMEGKTINRYVAEGNGPPEKVARLLREAAINVILVMEQRRLDAMDEGEPDGL